MQNLMPPANPHGAAVTAPDATRFSTDRLLVSSHPGAELPPPAHALPTAPSLPPILVADDDADDIYFVQRFIKKTGVQNRVLAFDDGSEVVNYLMRARLSECAL